MTAHSANFTRLAYRGLRPNGTLTEKALLGTLPSAIDLVGTPGKVVVSLEGGDRQSFEPAEAYLMQQALTYQIIHCDEVTGYKEALLRGLEQCQSALVAVIPAWIEVTDKQWVQRMMWSIGKDPTCLLCGTWIEQGPAKDLAPHVVTPRVWPGGDFFVARRQFLWENLKLCQEDLFYDELAQAAAANGWRLWAHPGVRFTNHEHEPHERKSPAEDHELTAADRHS